MEADWSQFAPDLIATFVGAGLGLGTALRLDRRSRLRAQREASVEQDQRTKQLLARVEEELRRAIQVLKDIQSNLKNRRPPGVRPLTDVWNATAREVLTAINAETIPIAYAEIRAASDMIDLYELTSNAPEGGHYFITYIQPQAEASLSRAIGASQSALNDLRTRPGSACSSSVRPSYVLPPNPTSLSDRPQG